MKDLIKIIEKASISMDIRFYLLAKADASNFEKYNKKVTNENKMIPFQIKMDLDGIVLSKEIVPHILRIEQLGRAVGVSIEYVKESR